MASTSDVKQKAEAGRSNVVDDLLLSSPRALAYDDDNAALLSPKKKIRAARIRAPDTTAGPPTSPALPFDSTEFSLQGSHGVLPTPLAALSYSSSCPFLAESTETKVEGEKKNDANNKEKEVVEDEEDDESDGDDQSGNKEKEVEKEEVVVGQDDDDDDDTDSESESEDVKAKKAKKEKKEKKAKKEKREKKEKRRSRAVAAAAEAEEKERQVREIEERMKRELARLEEQKERVRLELERLKSGAVHRGDGDDATAAKKSESEEKKERKTKTKVEKDEKKKKKKEKKKERRAESQQVATRNAAKSDADAHTDADGGAAGRALGVLEDAQHVRLRTQAVVSASAVVKTNTKAAKPKKEKKEKAKEKQKATKSESEDEGESDDELQSGPTVICTRHDADADDQKTPTDVADDVDDDGGKESESESDGEAHDAKKKEAKRAKKEEKEREKRRKKEEKERERAQRKEEKRRLRAERKAKKAERKQQRKKADGGSGLMASIDSNASLGSNDQEQVRRVEAALWSEFVPFILRESHAGLFASLAARAPPAKRRAKSRGRRSRDAGDGDGSGSESSSAAGSDSESESSDDTDTSSLSTSSSSAAASDVDSSGNHRRRSSAGSSCGKAAEVPAELEQLMLGLHRFLTSVVCNAGFAGSDVFEATAGRLAGLGSLFAHPLGRNAFAVALKKLARQNTSFLLTEEGFQCILCLIEQVINAFDFKRYETDLSVARVIMNIASTFHRTLNGSTQFVQQFITAYTIWRDLMFWEKYFWDELAVAQRKGYQQLDAGDGEEKKGDDAASTQQGPGDASTDASATPEEPEEFVPFNPTLIFVLLHSTAYNMLNWDVDVRSVRKFVTRMCKKTCLSHDQRQSIMEIVDSFAKSLLAPSEGSFDSPMQRSSSGGGSSDDLSSRKLGVRKKSTIAAAVDGASADHAPTNASAAGSGDKKPESAWNQALPPKPHDTTLT